mmetsp:Transcript_70036/g.226593  ORF Transcript_70036/g.226593 Transcript_70036/m.226593 type:complete len:209 (-) Transcript_70036:1190-1816(-)
MLARPPTTTGTGPSGAPAARVLVIDSTAPTVPTRSPDSDVAAGLLLQHSPPMSCSCTGGRPATSTPSSSAPLIVACGETTPASAVDPTAARVTRSTTGASCSAGAALSSAAVLPLEGSVRVLPSGPTIPCKGASGLSMQQSPAVEAHSCPASLCRPSLASGVQALPGLVQRADTTTSLSMPKEGLCAEESGWSCIRLLAPALRQPASP